MTECSFHFLFNHVILLFKIFLKNVENYSLLLVMIFSPTFPFSFCSIPAILCSNNWQSAVDQPSTSNHVAIDTLPIVIHKVPEFDQDSWTIDPQPGTEEAAGATQQPDQTNNNNNNSTFTADTHSPPPDSVSTLSQTADRRAATIANSGPVLASFPSSEISGTLNESLAAEAGETGPVDDVASEPQPTGDIREPPAADGEDVRESSTDSQTVSH